MIEFYLLLLLNVFLIYNLFFKKENNLKYVCIKKLHQDAFIPKYAHIGDAGFDLHALERVSILPGETKLIRTGLAVKIPENTVLEIVPRSGLSLKTKLRVSNSPGTLDENYTGEIGIIVDNNTVDYLPYANKQPIVINAGDRIAQGKLMPFYQAVFQVVNELPETNRNSNGFGSSGVK